MQINKIIKVSLLGLLCSSLYASEIEVGKGTFEVTGGFYGLDQTATADLTTYSFIEQHAPLFGSQSWFYKYNLSFYDSKDAVEAQSTINTFTTVPAVEYRLQGLDVNLVLGRDISHQSENDYVGLGVMLGISLPWIDSSDDSDSSSSSNNNNSAIPDTKTEMYTYKIGPSITARKSLSNMFSIYGSATYAYQTGTFKNTDLDVDLTVNGIFQEYDVGIRFQPVSYDTKIGWFNFSPRVYATLGYRYTNWNLKDINIDITGNNQTFTSTDFDMNGKVTYVGFGYSF